MADVIVGVDGSQSSLRAAQWAVTEAAIRGCAVRMISAYQTPANWLGMSEALGATMATTISVDDLRSYSDSILSDTLASLEVPEGVEVVCDPQLGQAADVLVQASKSADLLVVGSRGHGGFGSVLLGSTGLHCVHHSRCPVVVVPHDQD